MRLWLGLRLGSGSRAERQEGADQRVQSLIPCCFVRVEVGLIDQVAAVEDGVVFQHDAKYEGKLKPAGSPKDVFPDDFKALVATWQYAQVCRTPAVEGGSIGQVVGKHVEGVGGLA